MQPKILLMSWSFLASSMFKLTVNAILLSPGHFHTTAWKDISCEYHSKMNMEIISCFCTTTCNDIIIEKILIRDDKMKEEIPLSIIDMTLLDLHHFQIHFQNKIKAVPSHLELVVDTLPTHVLWKKPKMVWHWIHVNIIMMLCILSLPLIVYFTRHRWQQHAVHELPLATPLLDDDELETYTIVQLYHS